MNIQVKDITPAELRAIQDHKYFMSKKAGKEVSIDEAILDFLDKYLDEWRVEKTRRDNMDQAALIKEHLARGGDYDQWTEKYAPVWRDERESLEKNDFVTRVITIKNERGLHVRPSGTLVRIAQKFDCEIYVHKDGMEFYNFMLKGRPYMNVKSVLAALELLSLCVAKGQSLEFLSYGRQAKEALDEIERVTNDHFGDAK